MDCPPDRDRHVSPRLPVRKRLLRPASRAGTGPRHTWPCPSCRARCASILARVWRSGVGGMPLSGRPGDVLDEQLHLAHLLLPGHRPLVEEPGEHLEAGTIRTGGTAQSCWRARSFAKPISASEGGRSAIANIVIRSRCARRTSKRLPRRPRATRSDRPAPPTSIGR
jgi:hypothetical protein